MAIKDDDLLYVQRPSGPDAGEYKLTAGNLKTDLNDEYLSKTENDTAAGEITFEGGIKLPNITKADLVTDSNGNIIDGGSYVSITQFGGSTSAGDNTDAFNQALQTGKVVFVPPGTYNVEGTVFIPNRRKIIGSGTGATIIKNKKDSIKHLFENETSTTGNNHITISDLSIDLNNGSNAMEFFGVDTAYIERVKIYNTNPVGITVCIGIVPSKDGLSPSENIHINNCNIHGADYCIVVDQADYSYKPNQNIIISNCTFETDWGSCISLAKANRNVVITDNLFNMNGTGKNTQDPSAVNRVGIGVKVWESESLDNCNKDIVISNNVFYCDRPDAKTVVAPKGLIGISTANYANSFNVTSNVFNNLTEACTHDFSELVNQCMYSGNTYTGCGVGIGSKNTTSNDTSSTVVSNNFARCLYGIYSTVKEWSISDNDFSQIDNDAIYAVGYFKDSAVSANRFSSIGQSCVTCDQTGGSRSSNCVISSNIVKNSGIRANNTYNSFDIANDHIFTSNNIENTNANKPKFIYNNTGTNNRSIIEGNWLFGAASDYLNNFVFAASDNSNNVTGNEAIYRNNLLRGL